MIIVEERADYPMQAVVLPDDYGDAAASERVDQIAESIDRHGQIQPVGIDVSTGVLTWGRRRHAACARLGRPVIYARIVKFESDEERELVCLRENFDRADLSAEERREYRLRIVELEEQIAARELARADAAWPDGPEQPDDEPEAPAGPVVVRDEYSQVPEPRKRGGAPPKGRAEAAKKLGISERHLRREVAAAKGPAKQAKEPDGSDDTAAPPPIELFGIEVPADTLGKLREITLALDTCATAIKRAMGALKPLGERDDYPRDRFQKLYGELKFAAQLTRQGRPAWVCLDCKWMPERKECCARCRGSGYIVEQQTEEIPDELKLQGDEAGVFVRGKFKRVAELKA